jgi:ribosomal protein S18 acetylase RimI-like enzyme
MTYGHRMDVIEPARLSDVDALVELESLLFAEDAGVHDEFADVTWPRREGAVDFRRLLENDDCSVLIARSDDEVAGMVVGYVSSSSSTRQPVSMAILRSMYVRQMHRRRGLASRLTEAFVAWAVERGCDEAYVDSYFDNMAARALYESHGFAPQSVSHRRGLAPTKEVPGDVTAPWRTAPRQVGSGSDEGGA